MTKKKKTKGWGGEGPPHYSAPSLSKKMGLLGISLKPLQRWLGWLPPKARLADGAQRATADVVWVHGTMGSGREIFIPESVRGVPGRRRGEHSVSLTMQTRYRCRLLFAETVHAERYEGGDAFVFSPPRWIRVPENQGKMMLRLVGPTEETVASASFAFRLNEGVEGETTLAVQMGGPGTFAVLFLQSSIESSLPDVSIREVHVFVED